MPNCIFISKPNYAIFVLILCIQMSLFIFHFSFYALEYNGSYFLNNTARVAHWIVHLAQFIHGAQYRYHWQFVVRLIEFDIIFINKIKQINFKLTDFVFSFVYLINILRSYCRTVLTDMWMHLKFIWNHVIPHLSRWFCCRFVDFSILWCFFFENGRCFNSLENCL